MKNQLWGYIRYLLLGVITATALLWSVIAAPAVASAAPASSGKGITLSLPFSVASHWASSPNNNLGITWQTGNNQTTFEILDGKFVSTSLDDTWFVYGWFGALQAIKQPYNVKYPEWGDRHDGIDFAGREGIEIVSASAGRVTFAGKKVGNTVEVSTTSGYRITYAHLKDMAVKKGQYIKTGDLLGHLGNTGTINPHLHFQVDYIKKGSRTAINPAPLMNAEWGSIVIPAAEANQFYTDNQNPLEQPNFNW